ncbi:MAG: ABC-type spermidine/putrescine transport system, permease component I [candidate division TM6 bacterium GW2011_GWF2_38_10]|nr:MAG: ABC-type spermidine/putrescine transport system, permease component I [candidate division TM6 bacterium GW2011_GWF2_38_10]
MKIIRRIVAEEFPFILACPALVWQVFFLFLPVCVLLLYSFFELIPGHWLGSFTLDYYRQIVHSRALWAILNSSILALITSTICFVLAYPLAYFLAIKVAKKLRMFFLFLLILPSWTSIVVQVYAWFFLLDKKGYLTQFLYNAGFISDNFHFLNSYGTILIGMVSAYLPFMVFPIYAVLERMDKRFLEASADLGANGRETFRRVVFPLSLPGVYAGFLLVFIPSFGEFAIPSLLGGSKYAFWGSVIVDRFLRSRDWRSGAALAILGVSIPVMLVASSFIVKKIIEIKKRREKKRLTAVKDQW